MPIVRAPLAFIARVAGALLFVVVGVTLAKAAQYAAIDLVGAAIGRDAASFAGAAPVVLAAATLHLRYFKQSTRRSHRGG